MEFVIGIFVGALLFWLFFTKKKPSGTFVVDMSDPMNDETFKILMDEGINEICSKKQIVLNVKIYEYDSQK